jgi:hypothetical protein
MSEEKFKKFTKEEAIKIAQSIGMDLSVYSIDEFIMGLTVEHEHGAHDPETNVTNDDELVTGKIAWAHMKEFPDYYSRHEVMEKEAEKYMEENGIVWPPKKN